MKIIAIIYLAHDGFTSLYTGVGTVARDFLMSFPTVQKNIKKKKGILDVHLYIATIKYNNSCFGYSKEVKLTTESYCKKYRNIHLVELINGSAGKESYGGLDKWRNACVSAATFVYTLTTNYDKVIVIAVDTPFAQVANFFFDQYFHKNVEFIWLPQSTVKIHKVGKSVSKNEQGDQYIAERYVWEKRAIDLGKNNKQVKIGYVGTFMKKHLMKEYKASPRTLVSLQNGLYFKRLHDNKKDERSLKQIILNLGVPIDRPLIFSFGRAEHYKGLDLILKNSYELIKKKNYFVLILASPYTMKDPYISFLNKLAAKLPKDSKIIYDLDFLTPHYIMQWKNTKILALLSRAEPFGLIPLESRFYNNKNLTVLASNVDGYKEQITDGIDGFLTDLNNKSIKLKLSKISNLTKEDKEMISSKGHERVVNDYNQLRINTNFIEKYI